MSILPSSLAVRLILALTILVAIVAGVFGYMSVHIQKRQLLDEMVIAADQLSQSIISATWHTMLADQPEATYQIMETIGQNEAITSIRFFNKEGRVTYSTDPNAPKQVDINAEACNLCHAKEQPLVRESLAAWLMEDGYSVDAAESGVAAIDMVRAKDYAIAFVDLKMPPGIDGIETMIEIHKARPSVSVILMSQEWQGNVRQLENAIERAMVSCHERILTEESFSFLTDRSQGQPGWAPPGNTTLAEMERQAIEATLRRTSGNFKEAAAVLGIDRSTLYDKIKKFDIERPS